MTRLAAFVALPVVAAVAFFAVRYFDLGGSYAGALAGFATLSVTSTLLVMLARRPSAKDAAATTAADGPEPSRPAATAPPPVPEPEPAAAAVSTAGGGEPDAPAAPPEREPSVVGPAARPEREAAAVGPAAAKPRSYMGEDDEPTSEGDYMHRRLAQPSAGADPPPDGSAQSPPEDPGPSQQPASAEPPAPEQESPQLREPISGEFIPADERDQIDQHAAPEPPRPPQRPAPLKWPSPRTPVPERPQLPASGHALPATTPVAAATALTVNLGQASRALQRRVPAALDYYRREGVAPSIWAGVATSVVVTAVLWRLTRNGRSAP